MLTYLPYAWTVFRHRTFFFPPPSNYRTDLHNWKYNVSVEISSLQRLEAHPYNAIPQPHVNPGRPLSDKRWPSVVPTNGRHWVSHRERTALWKFPANKEDCFTQQSFWMESPNTWGNDMGLIHGCLATNGPTKADTPLSHSKQEHYRNNKEPSAHRTKQDFRPHKSQSLCTLP